MEPKCLPCVNKIPIIIYIILDYFILFYIILHYLKLFYIILHNFTSFYIIFFTILWLWWNLKACLAWTRFPEAEPLSDGCQWEFYIIAAVSSLRRRIELHSLYFWGWGVCYLCAILQNENLVALPLKRSPSKVISTTWALEGYGHT